MATMQYCIGCTNLIKTSQDRGEDTYHCDAGMKPSIDDKECKARTTSW